MSLLRALYRPLLCLWTARPWSTGKDCASGLYLWQALRTRDLCCFAWCEALVWFWVWESGFEWKWEWEWGWGGVLGDLRWTMYYGCAIIIPRGFLFLVVSDYFCSFFFFFLFEGQCCVSNGGSSGTYCQHWCWWFLVPGSWWELVGIVLHSFFCALAMPWSLQTALWNIDWFHCLHFTQPGVEYHQNKAQDETLIHAWNGECRASVWTRTGYEETCVIMWYVRLCDGWWPTKEHDVLKI